MPFFDAAAGIWLMQRSGKPQIIGLSQKKGRFGNAGWC